jgi:NAD(P)-dependent dehydrogenase (short-subunit alcohol dehydrogenase family)
MTVVMSYDNSGRESVKDRVALVTGASTGVGRATARALARCGARVMAVARREPLLAQLAEEIRGDYVVSDLATGEGCDRAVEETRRQLGPIEILVNNACGWDYEGSITDATDNTWRAIMAIGLEAPFRLSREAANDMIPRGWGRIVMVSSTAGEIGAPRLVPYCAAKAGVLGLMRAAAQDLAPHGVTCNAVLPGWVRTESSEHSAVEEARERGIEPGDVWAERAAGYEAGRVATPEEVAETIAFLCSPAAGGVNGEAIKVSLGGVW